MQMLDHLSKMISVVSLRVLIYSHFLLQNIEFIVGQNHKKMGLVEVGQKLITFGQKCPPENWLIVHAYMICLKNETCDVCL